MLLPLMLIRRKVFAVNHCLISRLCVLYMWHRVKQAIAKKEETLSQLREQYEKAVKRADHLEDLLEQQRKQLLGKK